MPSVPWTEWKSWDNWKRLCGAEIEERGLTDNLRQIEERGYTVLTPGQLGDSGLLERAVEALLRVAEKRTGVRPDVATGEFGATRHAGSHQNQSWLQGGLLCKDRAFEQIIQHPMTLPLVEYFLGPGFLLSAFNALIKRRDPAISRANGVIGGGFHTDVHLYPFEPLPDPPMVFNTNWCLTDYTKDDGCLAVVPESHTLRRNPRPGEAEKLAVPVEAPAGSVIVFHGNLWHGSFPRVNPGLRLTITAFYSAHYCRPQEHFPGQVTDQSLARNGERFRQLVNLHDIWGIETEGDHSVPRWERGSGVTLRQIQAGTVTHHGRKYRIEDDDTITDHAAGRSRYVPVD